MISSIQVLCKREEETNAPAVFLEKTQVRINKQRLEALLFIEKNYTEIIAAGVKSEIRLEEKREKEMALRPP